VSLLLNMRKSKNKTWRKVKLDELGFIRRGKSKHRPRNDKFLYNGDYPFIQTSDIKSAELYITDYFQTYNEKGLAQSKLWPINTLCITIAANIAESAILKIPACFPDSIVGFIVNSKKSDIRFVKYLIDFAKKRMQLISKGTTQDNLSVEKLLSIKIKAPDLDTQKKIANILSTYDDLIEVNNKKIKNLEKMSQVIYNEWFVKFKFSGHEKAKFENGIPEGWKKTKVGNLIKRVQSGKKYDNKTVSEKGKIPVLDQGRSGIIGYHNDEPGVIANEENPIIVFANHTCYQNLIMFPFSAIQNVLPFYPNKENHRNIYWLHWATKNLIKFNDYKGHWPEFVAKKLLLPSIKLCDRFGDIIESMIILKYKLEKMNDNLRKTRDLLLPKLMSGEIVV